MLKRYLPLFFVLILAMLGLFLFFGNSLGIIFNGEQVSSVVAESVDETGGSDNGGWEDSMNTVFSSGSSSEMGNDDFSREPLVYIRAFWKEIVKAPPDTSFLSRFINFIMSVREVSE